MCGMCVWRESLGAREQYQVFSMTFYPISLSQSLLLHLEFMGFGETGNQQTTVTLLSLPLTGTGVTRICGPCLSYYVYSGILSLFLMLI